MTVRRHTDCGGGCAGSCLLKVSDLGVNLGGE